MTLLVAGYWHSTYWAENYWQQNYWLEYGTAAPTPPAAVGNAWIGPPVPHPRFPIHLLTLIQSYLKNKIEETENG